MKTITLSVLLLLVFTGNAQKKSPYSTQGGSWNIEKKGVITKRVYSNGDGYIILQDKLNAFGNGGKKMTLEKVNGDLEVVNEKKIEMKYQDKKMKYEFSIENKKGAFLFSSFRNQKTKMKYLFRQKLNKNDLSLGSINKVAEISYEEGNKYKSGSFRNFASMDSTKNLIFYQNPKKKKAQLKFGVVVADDKLNTLWSKNVSLNVKRDYNRIIDYDISNNGDVYILLMHYMNKTAKKVHLRKPNAQYKILKITKGSAPVEVASFKSKKFIHELYLKMTKAQELKIVGLYNSHPKMDGYEGVVFSDIKDVNKLKYQKFPAKMFYQNLKKSKAKRIKEKYKKGKLKELEDFSFKRIMTADNGFILILEYYLIVSSTSQYGTVVVHHFREIPVIFVGNQGDIKWVHKINRRTKLIDKSRRMGYFYSFYNDGMLRVIYNGRSENLRKDLTTSNVKVFNKGNKGHQAVILEEFTDEGFKEKTLLMGKEESPNPLRMGDTYRGGSKLLFNSQKRKKRQYLSVDFK
ncbi:MAG: hypothetical protein N4A45_07675 [Flavobacteriales bacterium]|jgi:hypothetical protein|nr:hypothetical protein [Flavobacteriales bacterium]